MMGLHGYVYLLFAAYWAIGVLLISDRELLAGVLDFVRKEEQKPKYYFNPNIIRISAMLAILFASLAWPYFCMRGGKK
ncbi:hypothetical protein H845_244 [Komagataeibacter xylinus E25]|nr:hypothetical protein H845_244 [Komagataeibacter xylinus E25]